MDETADVKRKPNPLASANIFSKMFFIYISPLLTIASRKKDITSADLYNVMPCDSSSYQSQKFQRNWQKEIDNSVRKGKKPSILRVLCRTYGPWYAFLSLGALCEEALRITQPILLGLLIDYFAVDTTTEQYMAYVYAGLISLNAVLLALVHGPYFWEIQRVGMNARVALSTTVYQKVLRLSNKSLHKASVGYVNNVMTSDMSRFDRLFIFLHYLWLGPAEAVIILILLYMQIKWACLPGYVIMLLLIPSQAWMAKLFSKLRRKTAAFTDTRVAVMTEIVTAMRVIKMYAWENAFAKIVMHIRKSEIAKIIIASYPIGVNLLLSLFGNRLLDVGMIITYTLTTDEPIRASTIFVVVSFCRTLSGSFMRFFPKAVQILSECLVGIDRIENIMLLEEKEVSNSDDSQGLSNEDSIVAENVSCCWNKEEDETDTLKDVSFEVKKGQLTAVVGPVGCGKSSLLMSIIKELPVISGSMKTKGSISYASQQSWIFGGTVRQNILFGKPYDEAKFKRIIKVCALQRDLELFTDGDGTMVGERGVTLSGGQKARINLARALYDDGDIILLDDPLSAVDSHVGRHIFDQCIMGYLADKPRILVTHQLQYLSSADQIIVFKEGRIEGKGTHSELIEMGIDFAKLMAEEDDEEDNDEDGDAPSLKKGPSKKRKKKPEEKPSKKNISQGMFKAEHRKMGDVEWSTYGKYFKSGTNWFGVIFLIVVMIGAQVIYILADYWLALWAGWEEVNSLNTTETGEDTSENFKFGSVTLTTELCAIIYGAFVFLLMFFGLIRTFCCLRVMIKSSKRLHNKMFSAVVRSPILFFDTNPTGRIQNRFTKDIGVMDDQLPLVFFDVIQLSLQILGVVLLNAILNYITLILIVPLLVLFIFLRRYVVVATRPVKRIDGTARSPVFSHTTSTIHGLSTIRAYGKEEQFREQFSFKLDRHTEAWFAYLIINRWFGLRLDLLTCLFTAGVSFGAIISTGSLDAGLVGVILNNTISLTTIFQFAVRQTAMVENQMTSVERVMEYTKLEPEASLENPINKPPSEWPQSGSISMKDMSLKYSDDSPQVLQNLTCDIKAKEKIGIVGRTGAGKSSLITALFRLAEPKGDIEIDGISIMGLGLHDVRKKLSIIPQDPVLFSGTLRRNLDPFDNYSDQELWGALKNVQLSAVVEDKPQKLQMDVGESGSNFSVGQRQLICLARAIIKKNNILILDEATANVDPRTDALIQETIRTKFKECTVLTIAHRLNTIMDSDRIMVLDAGELKEFSHAHLLLQQKDSLFHHLVEQTGKLEASRMADVARENFAAKQDEVKDTPVESNPSTNPPESKNDVVVVNGQEESESEDEDTTKQPLLATSDIKNDDSSVDIITPSNQSRSQQSDDGKEDAEDGEYKKLVV